MTPCSTSCGRRAATCRARRGESLAAAAFAYTARYDTAIARWFQEKHEDFPSLFVRAFEQVLELSYGENPHQRAAYYEQVGAPSHVLSQVSQLGGKPISFNNLLDLDAGQQLLAEFDEPACVIIKHNNPCGVAIGATALDAYRKAFACDPMSAFGGIVCLNRGVDAELAAALKEQFIEVLFARGYSEDALTTLAEKQNMRILDDQDEHRGIGSLGTRICVRWSAGCSSRTATPGSSAAPTCRSSPHGQPTESEWRDLEFAWIVCKHVKSNAIVICRDGATIGIGAGQMSRVDSVRVAIEKARDGVAGGALASDAYFPFSDGPELALEAGVTSIVQPGGSVRDNLTIEAVDQAGAAMVFTGHRHFRH